MRIAVWLAAFGLSMLGAAPPATAQDRALRAELDLPAPPSTVWHLWSTVEGLQSFFAPVAHLEPRVDGLFEILFSPEKPAGQRGAEGLRIVAWEPESRLAFTWNAPPDMPAIRGQRTVVEIRLQPHGANGTRLTFLHWGWGTGPDWDAAFAYFDKAWGGFVLPSLQRRVEHGPIDWTRPPSIVPMAGSLRYELSARPAVK